MANGDRQTINGVDVNFIAEGKVSDAGKQRGKSPYKTSLFPDKPLVKASWIMAYDRMRRRVIVWSGDCGDEAAWEQHNARACISATSVKLLRSKGIKSETS